LKELANQGEGPGKKREEGTLTKNAISTITTVKRTGGETT